MDNALVVERNGSLLVRVRACPGSAREGIGGLHGGALKVAVRAPPERGKANAAMAKVLAAAFGLRDSQVVLDSGELSRDKRFLISGLSLAGFEEKLNRLLHEKAACCTRRKG